MVVIVNADELKEYIIESDCVEQILLALECHGIKSYPTEWRAALPNGRNKTAVCVKKDSLSMSIRSSEGKKQGDIFTLVMEIRNISFGKANKYIHNLLGLEYSYNKDKKEEKKDPLAIFKKIKRQRYTIDKDMPVYDDT